MKRVNWGIAFALTLFHAGALAAAFFFSWKMLGLTLVMWVVSGLGICIGYHRGLAHRSFRTSKLVEYFLTFCGGLALHGGSVRWLRTHLAHHADTDGETDPHAPRHGYFWSYIGWKLLKYPNRQDPGRSWKNVDRLLRDRVHVCLNKLFWVPSVIFGILFFGQWGISGVLWGVCVPVVLGWHPTWLVNLVCHKWGYKRFNTNDDSRNNPWLVPITFGECWHHNHHAQPGSARHGFRWYEIDAAWYVIWAMRFIGIVWAVILPKLR